MSHRRKVLEKKKLIRTYNKTKYSYGCGVWYDEDKDRYIRYSCHNEWLKTYCRRLVRRTEKQMYLRGEHMLPYGKDNHYKRYYDYWWEVT